MIALAFTLGALGATAAEPKLSDVLARAAAYVDSFERRLSRLAAEETYVQEATGGRLLNPMRTELHSHLLLVRSGRSGYVQYRDVFDVDGRVVGDRAERFTRLFNDDSPSADAQRRRILEESARFNIGDVYREMNIPLVALQFLSNAQQWRFAFKRTKDATARIGDRGETPPGTFRLSTDVWVVEYNEREPRTVIRTVEGRDLRSRGRIWIEPDSGRILMTELIIRGHGVSGSVNVSFKSEPVLGLFVPVEMRERYETRDGSTIGGVATYGRFAPLKSLSLE